MEEVVVLRVEKCDARSFLLYRPVVHDPQREERGRIG